MPNRSAFAAGKEELSGDDGMQAWRITGPERIERYEAKSGEVSSPSLVRVKIEQFAVSSRDIKTYESGNGAPIIPGRHGAGVVSEAHADDGFSRRATEWLSTRIFRAENVSTAKPVTPRSAGKNIFSAWT